MIGLYFVKRHSPGFCHVFRPSADGVEVTPVSKGRVREKHVVTGPDTKRTKIQQPYASEEHDDAQDDDRRDVLHCALMMSISGRTEPSVTFGLLLAEPPR